jgi:hypothetical protein
MNKAVRANPNPGDQPRTQVEVEGEAEKYIIKSF